MNSTWAAHDGFCIYSFLEFLKRTLLAYRIIDRFAPKERHTHTSAKLASILAGSEDIQSKMYVSTLERDGPIHIMVRVFSPIDVLLSSPLFGGPDSIPIHSFFWTQLIACKGPPFTNWTVTALKSIGITAVEREEITAHLYSDERCAWVLGIDRGNSLLAAREREREKKKTNK